jgi:UDP-2-acetamido-3-amino-2,3-dideoxy-glucuronate N-acetyltransferase
LIDPGGMRCLDLDEEAALPPEMAVGKRSYDEFRR